PDPEPARAPGLAAGALAGLRLLAGRGGPRRRHRHRPEHRLGPCAQPGLRPGRRGRGGLAAGRAGPAGTGPVTALMPVPAITAGTAQRVPRLLAGLGHPPVLAGHEHAYGPLRVPPRRPGRLIDVVEASGLTGRGGAGYPAGCKMRAVAVAPGRKTVVANGAEGEPASGKDRLLLTRLPHLVLDGIALAVQAVGADDADLFGHRTDGAPRGHLE